MGAPKNFLIILPWNGAFWCTSQVFWCTVSSQSILRRGRTAKFLGRFEGAAPPPRPPLNRPWLHLENWRQHWGLVAATSPPELPLWRARYFQPLQLTGPYRAIGYCDKLRTDITKQRKAGRRCSRWCWETVIWCIASVIDLCWLTAGLLVCLAAKPNNTIIAILWTSGIIIRLYCIFSGTCSR